MVNSFTIYCKGRCATHLVSFRVVLLKNDCYCGSLSNARRLFDEMLERDLVSWFIMISAYTQIGLSRQFRHKDLYPTNPFLQAS